MVDSCNLCSKIYMPVETATVLALYNLLSGVMEWSISVGWSVVIGWHFEVFWNGIKLNYSFFIAFYLFRNVKRCNSGSFAVLLC